MVLAHILNENRRVGLKELAKEYFGEDSADEQTIMKASVIANGGKLTKDCYSGFYKGNAELIAKYGAQDALLTFKLFQELVIELYDQGLEKFFYEDEWMKLLKRSYLPTQYNWAQSRPIRAHEAQEAIRSRMPRGQGLHLRRDQRSYPLDVPRYV